jgi:hypothetical protein
LKGESKEFQRLKANGFEDAPSREKWTRKQPQRSHPTLDQSERMSDDGKLVLTFHSLERLKERTTISTVRRSRLRDAVAQGGDLLVCGKKRYVLFNLEGQHNVAVVRGSVILTILTLEQWRKHWH